MSMKLNFINILILCSPLFLSTHSLGSPVTSEFTFSINPTRCTLSVDNTIDVGTMEMNSSKNVQVPLRIGCTSGAIGKSSLKIFFPTVEGKGIAINSTTDGKVVGNVILKTPEDTVIEPESGADNAVSKLSFCEGTGGRICNVSAQLSTYTWFAGGRFRAPFRVLLELY